MKFPKNKLQLFNQNSKLSNLTFLLLSLLVIISIILQVSLSLTNNYTPLIIIDSILLVIFLIFTTILLLKCKFSYVTIKNEIVIVKNMAFSTKIISYEDIKNIELASCSTSKKASDIWGDYIYVYDNNDMLIFKFSYDEKAYNLLSNKLKKDVKQPEQKTDESYEKYYNKMKSQNM